MGEGFQFFDIILFAAIAAFLVLRLRSVLGKRTGHQERPTHDPFQQAQQKQQERTGEAGSDRDKVIPMPDRNTRTESGSGEAGEVTDSDLKAAAEKAETPLSAGLTQIKLADRDFDEAQFLEGAKGAFEMVVSAFAQGDRETLRQLLADDVYRDFESAITEREHAGQKLETTVVNIRQADIIEAELQNRTAFVTVKFVSEQINLLRDQQGETIEGDAEHVADVTDIWTFARNTRSRDPNWVLVATRSPDE